MTLANKRLQPPGTLDKRAQLPSLLLGRRQPPEQFLFDNALDGFRWNTRHTVDDGDTIRLNGTTLRLWGIDSPEMAQTCGDWPAGVAAAYALADLMQGKAITCERKDRDRYGRSVGLCRTDGTELGAAMVSAGMAWAFTRYSGDYVTQERETTGAKLGVHEHDCEKPWDWRARSRGRPLKHGPSRQTQAHPGTTITRCGCPPA
jgi:endonuclease YncB( thermonuclease family)